MDLLAVLDTNDLGATCTQGSIWWECIVGIDLDSDRKDAGHDIKNISCCRMIVRRRHLSWTDCDAGKVYAFLDALPSECEDAALDCFLCSDVVHGQTGARITLYL